MRNFRKNIITVYTPTYNRGYCLHQLYESLTRQTFSFDQFEWLVVDDGSTDNTEDLVLKWQSQAQFKITYFKQKNEGKMAKLNFIHSILDTELCMCVDSDDFLTDNALEIILDRWAGISDKQSIAGIVGLNMTKDKNVLGTKFPENVQLTKFSMFEKLNIFGDKKFVYKSEIISSYPKYPSIKGERFPAPGYLYRLIDVDYDLFLLNEILCVVEYLDDGLSKNKYSQFIKSPNSFMFYRHERMRLSNSFNEKFRNAVHFVSSSLFAKQNMFKNNDFVFITFLALPFGVFLNLYLKSTNNKGVVK